MKNQRILMQFSLLESVMNDTCEGMNFTHLTFNEKIKLYIIDYALVTLV